MKKKRLFSLLLIAVMVLTMLPMTAFAVGASEVKAEVTLPEGVTADSFGENTVYYDGEYYSTMVAALKAVYMSNPQATAEVYCKPGADVGKMTHGHVADDITIYGNGAYVSDGEHDLEIDTYTYSRDTGNQTTPQATGGTYLDKDITVKVVGLDGIAAWGERHTEYTVNLIFENCKNMSRVYFTNNKNDKGQINISLDNCSFDAEKYANINTSVYSNAAGDIVIKDTTFKGILVGININHKSTNVQNITVDNCLFEDCGTTDNPQYGTANKSYVAPVRFVCKDGATSNVTVKDAEFKYSEGKEKSGNGDVLIGDGRHNAAETQGTVTVAMTGTAAKVVVQKAGYYTSDGVVADNDKAAATDITANDTLIPNEDGHFTVDTHEDVKVEGKKDATCTAEGYTGDKVCKTCGKVVEEGKTIAKLAHSYKDGKCTVCGTIDTNYKPVDSDAGKNDTPKTGDGSTMLIWITMLLISGAGAVYIAAYNKKTKVHAK